MDRRYWAVRLGEGGKFVKEAKKNNYIAIGWNDLGELDYLTQKDADPQSIEKRLEKDLRRTYQQDSPISIGITKGMIWNFVREMKEEDIVLVPAPNRKVLVGKVAGPYVYKENWGGECHYRRRRAIEWIKEFDRDDLPEEVKSSLNAWLTIFNVDKHRGEIEGLLGRRPPFKEVEVRGDRLVKEVINKIRTLSPREFEEFVSHLLSMIGFETATTEYVGDRGVDVIGVLSAEGLTNLSLKIQVRRVKGNIGIYEVQRLRGTLGVDEHGAIVTTSGFTNQAQVEAQAAGRKPIALVDGEMLVDLILKYYDKLDEKYKRILSLRRREPPLRDRFSMILEELAE
jgi:restriction system protein